ncbi:MAG: cytosine deaminase, partial [Alphaproteobacteria bacterium]|nr:cytosine deaminase [Alphaproteobacteria bacterium]
MALPTIDSVTCGRHLGPGATTHAGPTRLRLAGGRIAAVEPADAATGADLYALPALANAHDHGRGLRPAAYGAFDQTLETWLTALYIHPPVDPFLNAAVAFGRMARSGIGLVVHCHMPIDPTRQLDETVAVCRAAETIGIRLAFVVPMRDRARFGYFADEAVLARLPGWAADTIRG